MADKTSMPAPFYQQYRELMDAQLTAIEAVHQAQVAGDSAAEHAAWVKLAEIGEQEYRLLVKFGIVTEHSLN